MVPLQRLPVPPALGANVSNDPAGGTASTVPPRPNSHKLSPRAEPVNKLPAEYAAMYCLPACSNDVTGAFMPAPVWNSQSFVPFAESSAVSRPSLRPTNTRPPPVVSEPL